MPGSVANASPATVLPDGLASVFVVDRSYRTVENVYPDGTSQRRTDPQTSRKAWRLSRRLTAANAAALGTFYDARKGPQEPFYFYDLVTHQDAEYDATGALPMGRYTVRFEGSLDQETRFPRSRMSMRLVELA